MIIIVHVEAAVGVIETIYERLGPYYMQAWFESDVRNILEDSARIRFANQGGPEVGGAWADLHPATERIRESMGLPGKRPINIRRGGMSNYIFNSNGEIVTFKSGSYAWRWPHGTSSTSGNLRDKLKTAQRGGGSAGTAPPRPVLALSGQDVINIAFSLAANVVAGPTGSATIFPGGSFS